MSVLILLVIISIIVALCFLAAFIWSVKNGQYDDSFTPSVRILLDEENILPQSHKATKGFSKSQKIIGPQSTQSENTKSNEFFAPSV